MSGNIEKKNFKYYCHTHGYRSNPNHTRSTCLRLMEGHDTLAMADDTKGGSLRMVTSCKKE